MCSRRHQRFLSFARVVFTVTLASFMFLLGYGLGAAREWRDCVERFPRNPSTKLTTQTATLGIRG